MINQPYPPSRMPHFYYKGETEVNSLYAEQFPHHSNSFYDTYLRINFSQPTIYSYDDELWEENYQLSKFFKNLKDSLRPSSVEDISFKTEFENELRSKLVAQRKTLELNLKGMIALFKEGNQINTISKVALKIVNFFRSLFGYDKYETPKHYIEFDETDFEAYKTFSRKARQLTPEQSANAKFKFSSLDRSTGTYNDNPILTNGCEQVRRGLRGKVTGVIPDIELGIENNSFLLKYDPKPTSLGELKEDIRFAVESYDPVSEKRGGLYITHIGRERTNRHLLRAPSNHFHIFTFGDMEKGFKIKIEERI